MNKYEESLEKQNEKLREALAETEGRLEDEMNHIIISFRANDCFFFVRATGKEDIKGKKGIKRIYSELCTRLLSCCDRDTEPTSYLQKKVRKIIKEVMERFSQESMINYGVLNHINYKGKDVEIEIRWHDLQEIGEVNRWW